MDAKKLKTGYKKEIESKLIPLSNFGNNLSDNIDYMLSFYDEQLGHETKNQSLNYAANHFKDGGRAKEILKIIPNKSNIPDEKIIHEIDFVRFHVFSLMINDRYGVEKRNPDVKDELSKIHNLINEIEAGSIDTLEITLKATGKAVPVDVHLISDAIVRKIFECLKSLPKSEIKPRSKGRQSGVTPEIQMQRYCAEKIKETYSSQFESQNKLYEFIGYIFVAAGIYQTEADYQIEYSNSGKYDSYRDYLISKIKSLIG